MICNELSAITVPIETSDLHRPLMVARVSTTGELELVLPPGAWGAVLSAGAASALVNWLVGNACKLAPTEGP